jgi:glycosyltransferase involved in cell wall biosynthesis
MSMRISFSATNPCHLHPHAAAVAALGCAGPYYSGYPRWKLPAAAALEVRDHSLRTNIVYGLLKYAPPWLRPETKRLFRWQDDGFDRWVGRHLESADFIHAMPGQALETFRAARRLGIRTVLNHATGPVRAWVRIMQPEYARVGLELTDVCPYDDTYFAREAEEYALADFHCAASSVVREQLVSEGIEAAKIWQVAYGADASIFHAEGAVASQTCRIVFAGQVGLRKGLKTLLDALTLAARPEWRVDFYGAVLPEARHDAARYTGVAPLKFHGAVSQAALAAAFRGGSVLVLPSLEEGFGLVVPQALNCGLPCIVSDRTGAKDLVRHRENGSIFPVQNAEALAEELTWWAANPRRVSEKHLWEGPARTLVAYSQAAC